ncbi:MAG: phytoene desaturase family protein, partial [Acidobacteriota bacterium]
MAGGEIVVIGAGHNGLVAAAYLARAGRSVLVLERRSLVGGTATTEEMAPGFRCSPYFPGAELFDLRIVRDLRLRRHGLELLPRRGGVFLPQLEGNCLLVGAGDGAGTPHGGAVAAAAGRSGAPALRTAAEAVARASPADAAALAAVEGFMQRLAGALEPVFAAPLPDLDGSAASGKLDLLRLGWRLRRLGRDSMREAIRYLPMAIGDLLEERFQSQGLKAAIAATGLTGSWLGPCAAGSAFALLYHGRGSAGIFGLPRFVRGGLGALSNALADAARAAGAELRTGAAVARIKVKDGSARGLVLASGEEVEARVVVSNADPCSTLLGLVDPLQLSPEIVTAAANIRARGSLAVVALALDGLPHFSGAPAGEAHLAGRLQIGASLEALERAFDDGKHGRLPARPVLDCTLPSIVDPSLVPAGK